ncbi:ISKra4 family transposase [bacterium]|nr:ISKra4 family transposase [bacterium]
MSCCSSPVAVDAVSFEVERESWCEDLVPCVKSVVNSAYALSSCSEPGMGELEEEIARKGCEFQRQVLEKSCQLAADNCRPVCPVCGGALSRVSEGHERTVESRFGPIRIVRAYGYCRECKQWFFPADIVLGLSGKATASPTVQEAAALTVSKMPVADAHAVVKRLTGLEISPATMDREARRQGQRAEDLREELDARALDTRGRWEVTAEIREELGTAPFTLVIEIDAWNIRERDGWGQTEELVRRGETPGRWHWAYGATVFRLGERAETQSGRKMILSRGYVMTRRGVDALADQVFGEAVRQGMLVAEHILVVADGAAWIWKIAEDRFPWAEKRLDFYHASQHLWAVANEIYGSGTSEAKAWVEPLLHQLRHGQEQKVLRTLEDLKKTVSRKHRKPVSREAAYFESHRDRLDYETGAEAGEPIGSGAMESTCRQYQCRFKRPGQYWSTDGDEALFALETFWRSGRWHLLFPHAGMIGPARN